MRCNAENKGSSEEEMNKKEERMNERGAEKNEGEMMLNKKKQD